MPVLNDLRLDQMRLTTNRYGYSATRFEDLAASEYTLVTIVTDSSGSVSGFRMEMEAAIKQIIHACQYSPRADNLMLRLVEFNTSLNELHGFKPLTSCHIGNYAQILHAGGNTALYDATENAISATIDYAKHLSARHYGVNAIVFIITDGMDNASSLTPRSIKLSVDQGMLKENLESLTSILIGVNVTARGIGQYLDCFMQEAGLTQYLEIGRADAPTLAKLADFVSRNINAQSQALGTGGPSRSLTF